MRDIARNRKIGHLAVRAQFSTEQRCSFSLSNVFQVTKKTYSMFDYWLVLSFIIPHLAEIFSVEEKITDIEREKKRQWRN